MIRGSVLYRRLWYVRRRNARRVHVFSKLIIILVILGLTISYTGKRLMPCYAAAAREKTEAVIGLAINHLIHQKYSDMVCEDLTTIERDDNGRILSVGLDKEKQRELAEDADIALSRALNQTKGIFVQSRLGAVLGEKLSDYGPFIKVKVRFITTPKSYFILKIHHDWENRTIERIYMRVKTKAAIETPLNYKIIEFSADKLLGERTLTESTLGN